MNTRSLLIALVFLFLGTTSQAQFYKKLVNSAEIATERAIARETEQKVEDLEKKKYNFFSFFRHKVINFLV